MTRDSIDIALWVALAVTVAAAIAIPSFQTAAPSDPVSGTRSRTNDRKLIQEARLFMLQKRYEPVETLIKSGQSQQAILKLEEISRSYPADPHAFILRGELLAIMGAPKEAAASFARGVRLEGGYVDRNSPISRRESIGRLVESGLSSAGAGNTDTSTLKDLRYLQSRLAGGCE